MIFTEMVKQAVQRRGRATISQVCQDCPEMTREQVIRALQNCAQRGVMHSSGYAMEGFARTGVYEIGARPADKPRRERRPKQVAAPEEPRNGWAFGRVASVWDLGSGVTA
jgi:hypothetical protein